MTDRSVVYKLQADIGQFRAQMAQASASVQDFGKRATAADKDGAKFRAGLTTFGDAAGKAGLVAAAGLGATVKAAMDWETAWAGVTKTVDGSAGQMAALEGELRQLAKTLPASHQEIAAVAEAAGQLGVKRDDVAAFTKTMIDLGETTNLSANDAATAIARFTNVMGTAQGDVDRVGATIVELGNNFATTEAEITEMAQRLSAAGAIAGLSESDVLGFSAALTSVGVEAEAGGTALSKVFTAVRDASIDGGPKLETFATVAGTTADEFARMAQADPAKAIDSFIQGLGAMNAQGQSTSSVFKALGLTDQRLMRAMLSTAEAGDLLSEAVGTASDAWEENTALAAEAAKRYDTTASQVKISWNQIKDAGIEAGEALLPVVAGVAEAVGSLATTFGSLPGPVKNATTGLLGITAVFGGGLWFTSKVVNGVTSMHTALDNLGISGDKAAGGLGKVGKAAGIAGASLASMAIVDTLQRQFDGLDTGLEGVTEQLIRLSEAADGGKLAGEFDNIADSFDRLTDPNKAQAFQDSIYDTVGFLGSDSRVDEATAQFEALDAALTNLAAQGGIETAGIAFDDLAESMGLSAAEQKELLELLPQYEDALAGAKNEAALKAKADEDAAAATSELGAAAIQTEAQVKAQAKALKEAKDAARGTAGSFFNLGDAVSDTEVSLGGWIKTLHEQADALRNFRVNAEQAANKGLRQGLINALQEAGPEGALRMKQLANATETEIAKANRAWQRGQDEMRKYVNFKVPAKKPEVDISGALSAIQIIRKALTDIPDENVVVRVTRSGTGAVTPGFGPQAKAGGGLIHGPGTGTSDEVPIWASNKEYVIKAAAVEKYGVHMFDSLNAMHFAEGGKVEKKDRKPKVGVAQFVQDNTAALEDAIRRLTMVSEDQTKAVDNASAKTDEWSTRMASVAQATIAGFDSDLFASSGNPWAAGSGSGALFNLNKDIGGLNERAGLQSQLVGMGLTGESLAALLSQGSNSNISSLIASGQVSQYASLYAQRAALQSSVGASAGQGAFGGQYAAAAAEQRILAAEAQQTNIHLVGLNGRLDRMGAALALAADRAGVAFGDRINDTAKGAAMKRQGKPVKPR